LLGDLPDFNANPDAARILDRDLDDPENIYMALYEYADMRGPSQSALDARNGNTDRDLFRLDLFKVDVHTGKHAKVTAGSYNTSVWYLDGHGHVAGRLEQFERPLKEVFQVPDNDGWKTVGEYEASADHGAGIVGLSADGRYVVSTALDTEQMRILSGLDLKTASTTTLFSNVKYDTDSVLTDPWTDRVIGAAYIADKTQFQYFDDKLEALQKGLETSFPGVSVEAVSWNTAMDKVIVKVDSPKHPIDYYYLDRTTHQAVQIGSGYPDLQETDLGAVQTYPYKARDGLDIPAYLTLPPGKPAKNLPVVVMPHGGPDDRDSIRFDWMAQFFANRGYAVLQPNFRGSSGYGHKFTEAGLREWGLKMEDDLTDGVKKLVADGIADPKRVCIVGASYGRYAALAGAALTPDLYARAVSFAGISDLPKVMSEERVRYGRDSQTVSFWTSRIGSTSDDSEQLRATSPARHADRIKCPVLLMHGEGDTTVQIEQSEIMADAMKSAGKPVEFIRFPGEDHYFNFADTRIRFLKETEAFLKKNIGN